MPTNVALFPARSTRAPGRGRRASADSPRPAAVGNAYAPFDPSTGSNLKATALVAADGPPPAFGRSNGSPGCSTPPRPSMASIACASKP